MGLEFVGGVRDRSGIGFRIIVSLKAAFHFRVFHTHVYARKTLNRREH